MGFMWRCTECRTKVPYTPDMPEFCPNPKCKTRLLSDRDDSDVVMPFFRSAATTANDALYRRMEQASEHRVDLAAQKAGVPASEMSDLKITNLRETRHEGDIAAVPVNNSVTQFLAQNPNAGGFRADQGLGYSSTVATGPEPNRGATQFV